VQELGARSAAPVCLRVAGAAAFLAIAASCAAVDGLNDYEECSGACAENGGGSSGGGDGTGPATGDGAMAMGSATPPPGDDAAGETPPGEPSTPPGQEDEDASASTPDAGSTRAPVDATADAGLVDAPVEEEAEASSPGTGPTCGPRGATTRCNASQVCCGNLAAQTNACAASCPAGATLSCLTASDCSGSAPICCAQVVLAIDSAGDLPPKCLATQFSASCASACADMAPTSCTYLGNVRLCSHDADCAADSANPLAGGQCWNFNDAPQSWCTSAAVGGAGGGVHLP
jgi:hypothetical protein